MQAILFSAGYGTRLKPLTDHKPKALVEVAGKPVLQHNIEKLVRAGCQRIVVNVHHFPGQIRDFLKSRHHFGIEMLISDETDEILDTGGGLLKAASLFKPDETIIAHNVDVLSDLDLNLVLERHTLRNDLATLVVRDRVTQRYLLFDEKMKLQGWMNQSTGEKIIPPGESGSAFTPLAFSGIQVISPELLSLIPQRGRFSIIETYLSLVQAGRIYGFQDRSEVWIDIGKPEQLMEAERLFAAKRD
ncbi:MAG: nucleotidyltransferase family protein [Bacteroidota bacterium]